MLAFAFMRRVLIVGLMLSIMVPMIGIVMVNRKTSMIGDALSHTALTGVGMGLILGFDPLYGMIVICILASFLIEFIRERKPQYGDMATAIILSIGLGIASILSDFAPGGTSLDAYLFGSITSVTTKDLIYVGLVFLLLTFVSIKEYGGLLAIAIDPNLARLSGVKVKRINRMFTFLSAVTIALAVKLVGALMVTSLIVLPVATALVVAQSYRSTYFMTVCLGAIYMILGIISSYYFDVKPGGAIVIFAVLGILGFWSYRQLRKINV